MSKLFLFIVLLFLTIPPRIEATGASLSILPQTSTFTEGSTFDVSVFLNTGGNNVNAIKADLRFDPNKLQVIAPTKGISTIEAWYFPPTFSNKTGIITFQGGFPEGGINTSDGLISVIVFRAISTGETEVNFLNTSKILLADEKGTDILSSVNRGVYNIIIPPPHGPQIFSETHSDQNKWYKNINPTFSWQAIQAAEGYSYVINDDPLGEPDNTIDTDTTSISIEEIDEGIQYFHLKGKRAGVWSGTSHFKIMVDSNPPLKFKPYLETVNPTTASLLIYFNTQDLLSGISYYQVRIADYADPKNIIWSGWVQTESPFSLDKERSGNFRVLVRAFDQAGNFQEGKLQVKIINSSLIIIDGGLQFRGLFFPWWLFCLLIVIMISAAYLIYRKRRKKTELASVDLEKEIKEAEKEIEDVKKAKDKLKRIRTLEERGKQEWERLKNVLEKVKKPPEDKKDG